MKISKLLGIMFCGLIMGTGSKSHDVYICESCPEGTYSDTGEGCKPCPPGTYTDKMGSSECKTCTFPANYIKTENDKNIGCEPCPENHMCADGKIASSCPKGYRSAKGSGICKQKSDITVYVCRISDHNSTNCSSFYLSAGESKGPDCYERGTFFASSKRYCTCYAYKYLTYSEFYGGGCHESVNNY